MNSLRKLYRENRSAVFFVLKLIGLYIGLQLIYDFVITPYTTLDSWLILQIISQAESILTFFGYELLEHNLYSTYHMGIKGTSGVVIGNPCDGLSLFILFAAFIVVFKGKWWVKLLFVGVGILFIHILNVLRVVALALVVKYHPEQLDFHHSYTFTLLVYAFIFLLWRWRIGIYRDKKI
jgi:exosortase family protein XrtF